MKRKLIALVCASAAICIISGTLLFSASGNSTTPELKDLPREQRDEIIRQKEEMDQKQESAAKAESAVTEKDAASSASLKESLFTANGFTEEDLRVAPAAEISAQGEVEITQDYIYDRMLNTMDFYDSVQGSFTLEKFYNGLKYDVDYWVDGENHQSFERMTDYNGNVDQSTASPSNEIVSSYDGKTYQEATIIYDGTGKRSNPEKEIAYTAQVDAKKKEEVDFVSLVKASSRVQTDDMGINVCVYRENLNGLNFARESLEPQELITGYLRDFSTWEISGQETLLDRSCSVIKGTLSGDYSEKLRTASFTLWVDNETGILLKLEGYNGDGELSETITTTEFQAGIPISADEIQKMFDEA